MSPLLALALVALAIVVGLTLLQRRAHAQPRGVGPSPGLPASPPSQGPTSSEVHPGLVDPVLGSMTYDGHHSWSIDEDPAFAGTTVIVEIAGGPDGPDADAREYVTKALAQQADLDARARVVVIEEARRRGFSATQVEAYELMVGPDDDDALSGYLWFDVDDFEVELGVSSADAWRTLRLETLD